MGKITAYYNFTELNEELKKVHKIRSNQRLDCTGYVDGNNRLTKFVNGKGQLFLYTSDATHFVKADAKRKADTALTNSIGGNLTSLYCDIEFPQFAYGYPDKNQRGLFVNDGYLFVINNDYTQIELLIIENGRNLIHAYYQELIDGAFDNQLKTLRSQAKPFFDYWGATPL